MQLALIDVASTPFADGTVGNEIVSKLVDGIDANETALENVYTKEQVGNQLEVLENTIKDGLTDKADKDSVYQKWETDLKDAETQTAINEKADQFAVDAGFDHFDKTINANDQASSCTVTQLKMKQSQLTTKHLKIVTQRKT